MWIISRKRLKEFWGKYPEAEPGLKKWHKLAHGAKWENLLDVRRTFPNADLVKTDDGRNVIVFNVGGNNYRLITAMAGNKIYVLHVLTHREYDKMKWRRPSC